MILSLLFGTGPKEYEYSYHTGTVRPMQWQPDLSSAHVRLQLDFTIKPETDSIFGRFRAMNVPSEWKQIPEGTFKGKIIRLNGATKSFGVHSVDVSTHTDLGFDWEAVCDFDNLGEKIWISKQVPNNKGHDHFIGFLGTKKAFHFFAE